MQSDSTMITFESVSAQQIGPLNAMDSSIPSHETNETPNARNQRMRKLRSLFSCLFPRAQMENRWKKTYNLDSKCKGVQKNLIIKVCSIWHLWKNSERIFRCSFSCHLLTFRKLTRMELLMIVKSQPSHQVHIRAARNHFWSRIKSFSVLAIHFLQSMIPQLIPPLTRALRNWLTFMRAKDLNFHGTRKTRVSVLLQHLMPKEDREEWLIVPRHALFVGIPLKWVNAFAGPRILHAGEYFEWNSFWKYIFTPYS